MILVSEKTKVLVQGITGRQGKFHTRLMLDYGTKVVAGVTPGKGGEMVHGVPVYDSVEEALSEHEVDASVVFVPAPFAKDAVVEAIDNGIDFLVVITEHIPIHDVAQMKRIAEIEGSRFIGPNTPGIISPGRAKLGIMPHRIFKQGEVGVVSRSGTLTYEVVDSMTKHGIGQTTVLGIGGDPIVGTNFIDVLEMFEEDRETRAVVLIGEIGGKAEEEASSFIKDEMSKPVVAYIAGRTAPPGKRMGHAGAIISGGIGTAESKIKALKKAGVSIAEFPWEVGRILSEII